jgi:hypothetical protein
MVAVETTDSGGLRLRRFSWTDYDFDNDNDNDNEKVS